MCHDKAPTKSGTAFEASLVIDVLNWQLSDLCAYNFKYSSKIEKPKNVFSTFSALRFQPNDGGKSGIISCFDKEKKKQYGSIECKKSFISGAALGHIGINII